jgi:hypothetical protein
MNSEPAEFKFLRSVAELTPFSVRIEICELKGKLERLKKNLYNNILRIERRSKILLNLKAKGRRDAGRPSIR